MEMIELISPVAEFRLRVFERSPGFDTIAGRRAALLSNGKWNANELLNDVVSLLDQRYGVQVAFAVTKKHYNHELEADTREEVMAAADFALSAIGD